jgi:hypothetical protein
VADPSTGSRPSWVAIAAVIVISAGVLVLLDAFVRLARADTDDTSYLGWALRMLGRDLIMQGRLEEAREALDEGLAHFARDDISAMLLFMSDHAALAGVEGDHERQVRIVGAVQRMQRSTGTDLVDFDLNEPLGLEASVAALGDRAELVRAEGAAMDDDEAIRYTVGR